MPESTSASRLTHFQDKPAAPESASMAHRLDVLADWVEEPTRERAQTLPPPAQAPKPAPVRRGVGRPPKTAPASADAPAWAAEPEFVQTRSVNFRLPVDLYLKLKYLGDTTFRMSMTDIAVVAIEAEVARRLAERGEDGQ